MRKEDPLVSHTQTEDPPGGNDGLLAGANGIAPVCASGPTAGAWQLIEERVDEDYVSSPADNFVAEQFWGHRYIDNAVRRRTYALDSETWCLALAVVSVADHCSARASRSAACSASRATVMPGS